MSAWFATIHGGPIASDRLTVELMDKKALDPRATGLSGAPEQPQLTQKCATRYDAYYVRPAVPEDYAPGGEEAIPKDVTTPSPQQDKHKSY